MSYIFGGNTGLTYEQLQQQRKALEARKGQKYAPTDIGSGLSALGHAFGTRIAGSRLGKAEEARQGRSDNVFTAFQSILGGGATATPYDQPTPDAATSYSPASSDSSNNQPMDLSGDKQAFINALMPAAVEESQRTGVDPRVIVSQAALETGWGRSAPGNNFFGIKSHGKKGGQTFTTHEVIDGKRVKIRDSFRQYETPGDSVRGYGDFILQNPRYGKLRQAQGLDNQLAELQASGYATDPNYGSKVGQIARSIQLPTNGGAQPQQPVQVASADPNAGMAFAPQNEPQQPAQGALQTLLAQRNGGGQPQQHPVQQAQAQPAGPAPFGGVDPRLIQMMGDPSLSPQRRSTMQFLLQQHLKANAPVDPMKQLQMERLQLQNDQLRNPAPAERNIIKGADGYQYYQDDGSRVLPGVEQQADPIKGVNVDGNLVNPVNGDVIYQSGPSGPDFDIEQKLRKEFEGREGVGTFRKIRDAWKRVQASGGTPAGDVAMVFNFMKMIDPGSVVREGEFATAQNSAGIPERARAAYNQALTGERLTPEQRADFTSQAEQLFKTQATTYNTVAGQYRGLAEQYGLEPGRIAELYEMAEAGDPQAQQAVQQMEQNASTETAQPERPPADNSGVLDSARAAIEAGADRASVIKRLQEAGIDPTGL